MTKWLSPGSQLSIAQEVSRVNQTGFEWLKGAITAKTLVRMIYSRGQRKASCLVPIGNGFLVPAHNLDLKTCSNVFTLSIVGSQYLFKF